TVPRPATAMDRVEPAHPSRAALSTLVTPPVLAIRPQVPARTRRRLTARRATTATPAPQATRAKPGLARVVGRCCARGSTRVTQEERAILQQARVPRRQATAPCLPAMGR